MVFVAAVVFGYFSYGRLPVTLMPEITYPTLTVRTEYPGAAPEEVENDVSRPVEEALGVISGLRRVSSISRAGVSDVVLEFSWDTSMSDGDPGLAREAGSDPAARGGRAAADPALRSVARSGAGAQPVGRRRPLLRRRGAAPAAAHRRSADQAGPRADQGGRRGARARRSRGGDPRAPRRRGAAAHRIVDPDRDRAAGAGEHQRRRRHPDRRPHRVHGAHAQRVREPAADRRHRGRPLRGPRRAGERHRRGGARPQGAGDPDPDRRRTRASRSTSSRRPTPTSWPWPSGSRRRWASSIWRRRGAAPPARSPRRPTKPAARRAGGRGGGDGEPAGAGRRDLPQRGRRAGAGGGPLAVHRVAASPRSATRP